MRNGRTHIRSVLAGLAVSIGFLWPLVPSASSSTWDATRNAWCVIGTTTGSPKCGGCVTSSSSVGLGCAWIKIATGPMHPGTSIPSGYLRIAEDQPSPNLYTPQVLRYVNGYSVHGISPEETSGGVPRDLIMVERWGLTTAYRFNDNSAIGAPYMGPEKAMKTRIIMVDAEGWSVTNSPAYYDLYPGDGTLWRFGATAASDEYLQLVKHRTASGREETLSDIDTEIIRDNDWVLRQILAPSRLADIVVEDENKYQMRFYKRGDVLGKDGDGYYQVSSNASPIEVWTIENPEPATLRKLRVSKEIGTYTSVWNYVYIPASDEWQLSSGGGLRTEEMAIMKDDSGGEEQISWITRNSVGTVISKIAETVQTFGFGKAVVTSVEDPDGAALTSEFTYYDNPAETGKYGNTKTKKNPDGSWITYDYTTSGAMSVQITPWQDSSFNSAANQAKAIYYDYSPVDTNDSLVFNDQRARTVTEKILGQTISKTYYSYATNIVGELIETVERCADTDASYGDSSNLRTITTYYGTNTANQQIGRIKTVESPDGRLNTYTYEHGNYHPSNSVPEASWFEPDTDGNAWRRTVVHGTTNSPNGIANRTTRDVTVLDEYGQGVLTEAYVYTGSTNYERIAWTVQQFNDQLKSTRISKSTGEVRDTTWAACACQKASEVDASGVENVYSYDLLNRLVTSTKKGTNSPTNDLNRVFTYDAMDRRLTEEISGGSLSLTTSSNTYDLTGRMVSSVDSLSIETAYNYQSGGRIATGVRAGLTNITERYLDGRTKCTKQNGVVKTWSQYGVNTNDNTQWSATYTGPAGTNSPMWTKTVTDMLGRTVRTEKPGFAGTALTNEYFYNTRGLLVKTTSPGMADSLYEHDSLGDQVRSGLDIDGDGVLILASMDRISETERYFGRANFTSATNEWASISISKLYPADGTNTVITNSISKTRLTGLGSAGFTPATVLVSESVSTDIHGNETTTRTETDRDSRKTVQLVNYPDSTNDAVSTTVNGLLVSSSSRSVPSARQFSYDGLERRISTIDPRTGASTTHYNSKGQVDYVEDPASNRTAYAYSATTGHRTAVTNALGKIVLYEYSLEGQLIKTWGDTVYPVSYSFDDYDRMQIMTTYRNGLGWSGTTWPTNTGAADTTQWLYDDATGLLTNKLYADGNGTAYSYTLQGQLATRSWARGTTTTYGYTNTTGEMIGIDYSDSTPDISFIFDRLGRQTQITDAQGSRTFSYDSSTLALTNETIVANGHTNIITRVHDSLGRPILLALHSLGDVGSYSVNSAYSSLGRLSSLESVVLGITNTWQYSYLANSGLISGVSNSVNSVKTYEGNRNLITEIHNQAQGSTISKYEYANDALGRRTQRIDTLSVVTTNGFGYNSRSELVDADMGTNLYNYVFDNIGNRISATFAPLRETTYLSNELNQYTNIANGVTNMPTYDLDGNMLTHNGWTYSWNGENRMVQASNSTTVVSMVYDYMGRRVRKVVEGVLTNTFVYDGWNMVAESGTGVSPVANYYVWGLDLSGSMQGAGGIGGLLATVMDGDAYFSAFDANGNLTDYVDTNGTVVAHYEYGPFGGIIDSTGTRKDDFNFRFSTKYLDAETDWYYYGYRYYNPELGRFPSRDPLGELGGVNLYGFVVNDPIAGIDVLGLVADDLDSREGEPRNGTHDLGETTCPEGQTSVLDRMANTYILTFTLPPLPTDPRDPWIPPLWGQWEEEWYLSVRWWKCMECVCADVIMDATGEWPRVTVNIRRRDWTPPFPTQWKIVKTEYKWKCEE